MESLGDKPMLIIELLEWKEENWEKVAECPAKEVFDLKPEQAANFWITQDERNRAIMLRMEGEK